MNKNITPEEKLLKIIRNNEPKQKIIVKRNLNSLVNKVLIFGIVLASVYLVFGLFFQRKENIGKISKEQLKQSADKEIAKQNNNAELVLTNKKDIFAESGIQSQKDYAPQLDIGLRDQVLSQFTLVGVMGGNEAIVEDKTTNKTYFLHRGEMLSGLKVKEIKSDKIILDVSGQEVELVL